MNIKRGLCFSLVASASLLFVLTACGTAGTNTTSAPKPKSAKELLTDSKTAMDKLKSDHSAASVTIGGLFAIAVGQSQGSTASGDASKAAQLLITEKNTSDNVSPDQSQGDLAANIAVGTQTITSSIKQVTTADAFYVQNAQGKWYALDKSVAENATGNPFAQTTDWTRFDHLYAGVQEGTLVDHGVQKLNGVSLRHITTKLSQAGMLDEIKANGASSSATDNSDQKMMSEIKTATVDVWVDEATSYVHQIDVKIALKADANTQASTSNAAGDPSALTMTATYSNFNKTVKIEAPKGAATANSVQAAMQGQ